MNVLEKLAKSAPGAGPPSDVEPTELLRKLMAVERPSEVLPFPRNDADGKPVFSYRMRILTQWELDQARMSAERYTADRLKTVHKLNDAQVAQVRREAWSEIYEDAKACELLCIAMCEIDPVDGGKFRPLFTGANKIRELLTNDEIASLMQSYDTLQMRFGPLWRLLTDEELEEWERVLEGGAKADPLFALSHGALVQLSVSLVSRFSELRTATSSDGSQSSEPQTDCSPSTSDAEVKAEE